jgi:hypothetical protein
MKWDQLAIKILCQEVSSYIIFTQALPALKKDPILSLIMRYVLYRKMKFRQKKMVTA